jgi:pyridoxine kinase
VNRQKRVAAIHDISGVGKCSLTVALPVISSVGIEVAAMPTAVLSTQTGGLENYTYRDLTEDMRPIAAHWKELGISFDAIYSGFLGSQKQIEIVKDFIDEFKRDETLVMVDPAMADNGKMYSLFDLSFAEEMRELCAKADFITPNMTEAALLSGEKYIEPPYEKEYIEGLLKRLANLGPTKVVLTGVSFEENQLGAAAYDSAKGEISYAFSPTIPGLFHGTGDIFASALLAALICGKPLARAVEIAVDFTCGSIKRTGLEGTDPRLGVNFEAGLPNFIKTVLEEQDGIIRQ